MVSILIGKNVQHFTVEACDASGETIALARGASATGDHHCLWLDSRLPLHFRVVLPMSALPGALLLRQLPRAWTPNVQSRRA